MQVDNPQFAGSLTAGVSTTSTTPATLLALAGTAVPENTPFRIVAHFSKTGGARWMRLGLSLNGQHLNGEQGVIVTADNPGDEHGTVTWDVLATPQSLDYLGKVAWDTTRTNGQTSLAGRRPDGPITDIWISGCVAYVEVEDEWGQLEIRHVEIYAPRAR